MQTNIQTQQDSSFSETRQRQILLTLMTLYPLVGMGIDLISPSLPAISKHFMTSSSFSINLITLYMFGYAIGNFIMGLLSDALGRRKLMLYGFLVFVIVSILPAIFAKPFVLIISRLLQGFSIAAFAAVSRAVLADILPKEKLVHSATFIATMWGIGPIIGPIIGGYLQYYFNWQACFYFFAAYGCWGLITLIFLIPETHFHRQPLQLKQIANNFITVMSHRTFIGIVILMGTTYSLLIVFNALGPFLIQSSLGYTSIYFGHIAFIMGFMFLLGTFFCRKLLKILQPEKLFYYTIIILLIIATFGVIAAQIAPKNIWLIIILTICMFLGCGSVYPAALGKGISLFRNLAGSASAIMNLINILITTLTGLIMSHISATSAMPLALTYLSLMIIAFMSYYVLTHSQKIA